MAAYQAGATGKGVKIGIVDSGINPALAEFAGRIDPASRDVAGDRRIVGRHFLDLAEYRHGALGIALRVAAVLLELVGDALLLIERTHAGRRGAANLG